MGTSWNCEYDCEYDFEWVGESSPTSDIDDWIVENEQSFLFTLFNGLKKRRNEKKYPLHMTEFDI